MRNTEIMQTAVETALEKRMQRIKSNRVLVVRCHPDGYYGENPTGKKWYHQNPNKIEDYHTDYQPKIRNVGGVIKIGLSVLSKIQSRIDKSYHKRRLVNA